MADFSSWSLNLGLWRGVRLRLHAFFLVFGVFALYLSSRAHGSSILGMGFATLGVLLVSVLIHEIGHCYAAFRVGGVADQIVIGPLGGMTQPHVPHEPLLELIVALAGPIANLLVCVTIAPLLFFAFAQDPTQILLSPLDPPVLTGTASMIVLGLKLFLWINWLLAIINILPAFPFDGGRVLRALFWRAFDYRTSVLIVAYYAKVVAIGLTLIALWNYKEVFSNTSLVPTGVPLLLLAILLFFSAQQEADRLEQREAEEGLEGYDFSQGYTSLERTFEPAHRGPGPLRRWIEHRRQTRRARQRQIERDEEKQFDTILARIHETGMEGLTSSERALLDRVSARYRNRTQS